MQVAGLLSHEQLSTIFLNVEELAEVNKQFTENLRDAIEIALDEGDEDLCTVKIGRIFKDAEPMLGAFKSYCTRQVSLKSLKCCPRFYRRSKVLTNFFLYFRLKMCSTTYLSFFLEVELWKIFHLVMFHPILFCVNAEKLTGSREHYSLVKTTHSFYWPYLV